MNDFFSKHLPILTKKDNLLELWPYRPINYEKIQNIIIFIVVAFSLLGYILSNYYAFIILGIILILIISHIGPYKKRRKKGRLLEKLKILNIYKV